MVSAWRQYSKRVEFYNTGYNICFKTNSISTLWCFLLIAKIGVTEKEVYLEWLLSLLYVINTLTEFFIPIPAGLETLAPKGDVLPLEDTTMIPMNGRLKLTSDYVGIFMPLNQVVKKRGRVLL